MRRWLVSIAPFFAVFLAAIALSRLSFAAPLPANLEPARAAAISQLAFLYGVPPAVAAAPIEIDYVTGRPPAIPASWKMLPSFAAGGALPAESRLIVVEARTGNFPFGDPAQTLRHEISHVLLYRSIGGRAPRWLDEGLALRVSGEWSAELSPGSLVAGRLRPLSLDRIETDFVAGESEARRSYELARGFVSRLFPTPADLSGFLNDVRARGSFNEAFVLRFGESPGEAFERWTREMPIVLRLLLAIGSEGLLFGAGALLLPIAALLLRRRRKVQLDRIEREREIERPPLTFRAERSEDEPPGWSGRNDEDGPVN